MAIGNYPESSIFTVVTMTAARRQRKTVAALILSLSVMAGGPAAAQTGADDPVVVNFNTGLAISGFDPVAYFTDKKPTHGRPELELSRDDVTWRFANEGNKAAFIENPEVYAPRFGGYDPVAIARGASVAGHPLIWTITGARLYMFYDNAARDAFAADPGRFLEAAERKWPEVARTIAR